MAAGRWLGRASTLGKRARMRRPTGVQRSLVRAAVREGVDEHVFLSVGFCLGSLAKTALGLAIWLFVWKEVAA